MNANQAMDKIRAEYERAALVVGVERAELVRYAVILEELDELWAEIKVNPRDVARITDEAIQVATMALRFLVDRCPYRPAAEPRLCPDCHHPWGNHAAGGMCGAGGPSLECYCVNIPAAEPS